MFRWVKTCNDFSISCSLDFFELLESICSLITKNKTRTTTGPWRVRRTWHYQLDDDDDADGNAYVAIGFIALILFGLVGEVGPPPQSPSPPPFSPSSLSFRSWSAILLGDILPLANRDWVPMRGNEILLFIPDPSPTAADQSKEGDPLLPHFYPCILLSLHLPLFVLSPVLLSSS